MRVRQIARVWASSGRSSGAEREPWEPVAYAAGVSETHLDAPRLWLEFVDPEVAGQRFRVDLTWLTSTHRCVFGTGCPGIVRDRPYDGCCTLGAEFTGAEDLDRVAGAVARLDASTWQLHDEGSRDGWHEAVPPEGDDVADPGAGGGAPEATDRRTRVVGGACVLLNRPGFAGGAGCALHQLATTDDVPSMYYKPDVCWQLPIRRTYRDVTLADESTYLEVSIGEFDRRGWGPGGHDLDWYCTGSPIAHGHDEPVYRSCAAELRELMGEPAYQVAAAHCEGLLAAAAALAGRPGSREALTLLVHPASLAAEGFDAT